MHVYSVFNNGMSYIVNVEGQHSADRSFRLIKQHFANLLHLANATIMSIKQLLLSDETIYVIMIVGCVVATWNW